jgi:hypothetical protein
MLDAYIIQRLKDLEEKKRQQEDDARPRVYIELEEPPPVSKPKEPERKEPIVFDL